MPDMDGFIDDLIMFDLGHYWNILKQFFHISKSITRCTAPKMAFYPQNYVSTKGPSGVWMDDVICLSVSHQG